jgi:hypothetical protein
MIDESKNQNDSIQAMADEAGTPYLVVATAQVEQVKVLLDGVGLPYTISENAPGVADVTTIRFDSKESVEQIQRVLDGIN